MEERNGSVINCMSQFYMFVPTKATVKLANGKTGHTQGIGIILCCFPNCSIIYPVGPVHSFSDHPFNTSYQVPTNFMFAFKRLLLNLLNMVTLLIHKVFLGYHPTRIKKILTVLKYKLSKLTLTETRILMSQFYVYLQNKMFLR